MHIFSNAFSIDNARLSSEGGDSLQREKTSKVPFGRNFKGGNFL
jgi:hypothetical protein